MNPPITVVSVEQALAMPYATSRFVHLGWRVIRVESTPVAGRASRGDPNRFIGRPVGGEDRHSYFVAPNCGKEAVALNLKAPEGREALQRMLEAVHADVFCTNTLPAHHAALGIDAESIRRARPAMVWASISAMGVANPKVPGYDPMMQALCGYMDVTGDPAGPPMQCGPPIIDLKAGDEIVAQTLLALWERERSGEGKTIDVSMARAAASWLLTFMPMLDMGSPPEELRRAGNQHRQFIPVNAYPTSDGHIFVAVGSDAQWERFVGSGMFAVLARDELRSNEGRRAHQDALHAEIAAITAKHPRRDVARALSEAGVPNAPITRIEEVAGLDCIRDDLLRTRTPDGGVVRLPPPAVSTEHLDAAGGALPFAPSYGEHSESVLLETGYSRAEISAMKARGIVA